MTILLNILNIIHALVAAVMKCFIPFLKRSHPLVHRFELEREFGANSSSGHAKSFKNDKNNDGNGSNAHKEALVCIHFSSEGEFQQVRPLIIELLEASKLVEVIYTSPSVHNSVEELKSVYSSDLLRAICLNVLSPLTVYSWVSARQFMMVRYDFFACLLIQGRRSSRFWLYSATLKSSNRFSKIFKYLALSLFSDLIPATVADKDELLKAFGHKGINVHDFSDLRALSIYKRQTSTNDNERLKALCSFLDKRESSIILAQFWENELEILKSDLRLMLESGSIIYIAPHDLSLENRQNLIAGVKEIWPFANLITLDKDITLAELNTHLKNYQKGKTVFLSLVPGVLCEIYPYFDIAFVGGGHGKGIHSVLEPFIANCQIVTGPHVGRSTEFDLINSLDHQDGLKESSVGHRQAICVFKDLSQVSFKELSGGKKMDISQYLMHNKKQLEFIKESIIKTPKE